MPEGCRLQSIRALLVRKCVIMRWIDAATSYRERVYSSLHKPQEGLQLQWKRAVTSNGGKNCWTRETLTPARGVQSLTAGAPSPPTFHLQQMECLHCFTNGRLHIKWASEIRRFQSQSALDTSALPKAFKCAVFCPRGASKEQSFGMGATLGGKT